MKKIIIATDSFKSCLTATEVAQAVAEAVRAKGYDATALPVTDGGDGMLDAMATTMHGEMHEAWVHDALMRPVKAHYALTADHTAIIETAQACGIILLKPEELNPLRATTYGVGELIVDAIRHGARRLLVGLGGSATSDCGLGMLRAMKELLGDQTSPNLHATDDLWASGRLPKVDILSDVTNPLYGPNGAAAVYGPQKGATPEMVALLDRRAQTFAEASQRHFGIDCSGDPGAGAAGGLGYAFMEYLHGTVHPGAEYFLRLIDFDRLLQGASLVITAEGAADRQTLMGKITAAVMHHAHAAGLPTLLLAGRVADQQQLLDGGFAQVVCINDVGREDENPLDPAVARRNLSLTIENRL